MVILVGLKKATIEVTTHLLMARLHKNKLLLTLPGHTSVVQAFLSRENDPQSPPQILRVEAHYLQMQKRMCYTPQTFKRQYSQNNRELDLLVLSYLLK